MINRPLRAARPYRVCSTRVLCCWTNHTARCLPALDCAI